MGEAEDDGGNELRVKLIAPWWPNAYADCVIRGSSVNLRDAGGSEVQLTVLDFVKRTGRVLRFCSRHKGIGSGCIEFAGLGRDAWFEVTCLDDATAEMAAARIKAQLRKNPRPERERSTSGDAIETKRGTLV